MNQQKEVILDYNGTRIRLKPVPSDIFDLVWCAFYFCSIHKEATIRLYRGPSVYHGPSMVELTPSNAYKGTFNDGQVIWVVPGDDKGPLPRNHPPYKSEDRRKGQTYRARYGKGLNHTAQRVQARKPTGTQQTGDQHTKPTQQAETNVQAPQQVNNSKALPAAKVAQPRKVTAVSADGDYVLVNKDDVGEKAQNGSGSDTEDSWVLM